MTEQAMEARRAYKRKYYAEHPDKQKEYNATYWERKAAEAEAALQNASKQAIPQAVTE